MRSVMLHTHAASPWRQSSAVSLRQVDYVKAAVKKYIGMFG